MYRIGEFSRISGLPVKTLRFYHEKGVLVPAAVDPASGYRLYGAAEVEKARVIRELRRLEFSLEDVAEILSGHEDESDVLEYLERQKERIREKLRRQEDIVSTLSRIIEGEKEARKAMEQARFDVVEKDLPPVLVAGMRMQCRYAEMGKGFGQLAKRIGRWIAGKPLCLYYDAEYKEENADLEPCFPVRAGVRAPEGISAHELPGGRFVSLIHKGPYEELGRSYDAAFRYAKERGYEISLPTREVYLKGPGMILRGNPKRYLTEILLPIAGKKS
jgi:DNA-binding transcriptional MerR regulator/effector-binding domain-containing protein